MEIQRQPATTTGLVNYPSTYLYEEALVWMYHSAGTTPGNDNFSGNTRNTAQWGQHDVHMIRAPAVHSKQSFVLH